MPTPSDMARQLRPTTLDAPGRSLSRPAQDWDGGGVVVLMHLVGGASLHPTVLGLRSDGMLTRGLPSFLLGIHLLEIAVEIRVGRITTNYLVAYVPFHFANRSRSGPIWASSG